MSKVVNAPTAPNDGGYEKRQGPDRTADKTSGSNATSAAHAFEGRATQEQGNH